MSQSSSSFAHEINSLTREFEREEPNDVLQFCANFFLRRLEAQRAEFLLAQQQQQHSSAKFPGSNPFSHQGPPAFLRSEIAHDQSLSSPTASSFPSTEQSKSVSKMASDPESTFGNFGGFSDGIKNASGPPSSFPGTSGDSQSFPSNYNMGRRTSVSAESLNPTSSVQDNWTPPFHAKTADQQARLKTAVAHNFLFSHLDEEQATQVLGALQEKLIPAKGIKVIVQGDEGDYFYVVEKGSFDIFLNPSGKLEPGMDGMGEKVGQVESGGSFGELALMYNAPRAATVVSREPSTLWALDRVTFRRILMDSAFQRRRMYESFLEEVPLLASLTPYERSKIADALETTKFPPNTTIIREGDPGESFFILETGEAEVFKQGTDGPVNAYSKGDYFGELALLNDAPRAASVVSKTDVKVATLGKDGFQRLLGPVEGIMRRNDPSKQPSNPGVHVAGDDGVDPLAS